MNKKQIWKGFLVCLGFSLNIQAHDLTGSLGTNSSSTDVHAVSCNDDGNGAPAKIYFQFLTAKGTPKDVIVSMQMIGAANVMSLSDPNQTGSKDVELASPNALVLVNKNKAGNANYAIVYHCETALGDHTGTDVTTFQNQ